MKISIVHFADLHADRKIEYFTEKVRDISKRINEFQTNDVLLLFSGDLTQSGQESQFNTVSSFINQIRASTNNKKIHVACCPGNHDRSFKKDESFLKEEINKINTNNYCDYFDKHKHLEINYRSFEDGLHSHKRINDVLSVYDFFIANKKIRIFSLDNSLLTHFDPEGKEDSNSSNFEKIVIPNDFLDIKRENSFLCLLIMHMPLNYFSLKTKRRLVEVCNSNIDAIIDGHIHEENILKDCGDKKFLEFNSPALASNETSGFTVFDIEDDSIDYCSYSFDNNSRKYNRTNNGVVCHISFNRKISTIDNLMVNRERIDSDSTFKTASDITIKLDEVFVFPLLSTFKYAKNKRVHIPSFKHFVDFIKDYSTVQISSEDDMGKTALANRLFHSFVELGYMPVTCFGYDFGGYNKNKNKIDAYIDNQIKACYLDSAAVNAFNDQTNVGKRILIVDDFDSYTEDLISRILTRFDKVVFFVDAKIKELIRFSPLGAISFCKLEIEPMYKIKRQELFERVYEVVKRSKGASAELQSKEDYLVTFETYLSKLDKNNTLDPRSIIELASKVLVNSTNLANIHNLRYQIYYYDHAIEQALCLNKFNNCSTIVANRIIAYTASVCYRKEKNSFSTKILEEAINVEEELYGGVKITDPHRFADVLCDANVLKKDDTNDGEFAFSKRKVLAYFVGKYAIERLHTFRDSELMDLIIQRGVYNPLNFSILMSIASNYSYGSIPNYFVNDLYKEIMEMDLQLINTIPSIKAYFKEDKDRLINLSKEEKQRIKKNISKNEEDNRKQYLKNSDNYFYVEKMNDGTKEILDLFNKMVVVSSLLCSSDSILKDEKKKLSELVIKLPNVIIDKYLLVVKKSLERIYVEVQECAKEDEKVTQADIDEFFDFLTTFVTAFILSVYDTSVRFLGNANISKEMDEQLRNTHGEEVLSNMYSIQRLMLLSYTNKTAFAEEAIKFIKETEKKNKFYSTQAKLIARRYYFDNEVFVNRNQRSLLNTIGGYKKMKIEETKHKITKR